MTLSRDAVPALARLSIVFQKPTLISNYPSCNLLFHAGLMEYRAPSAGAHEAELTRLGLAEHAHCQSRATFRR